ncbi:helix-turn-helix domain-containing protein [Streptomyces sp. QH1-20]|uniref:helix-turn-helix domain-containing protein n=1 Tax=Streptomyces sp. QH1-20 TaxID=3240934 RepID=UPI003518BF3E
MFDRHIFATRRLALGLTVEALADALSLAPSTIRRWESGVIHPGLHNLVQAARHMGTPLMAFVTDDDTDERRRAGAVAALRGESFSQDEWISMIS